jgi:AcrR family transcriptional regulator
MAPSLRRVSIVSAALPIMTAKGDSIIVAEVAQAADVAEVTVFKVFPKRDDLIQSCL